VILIYTPLKNWIQDSNQGQAPQKEQQQANQLNKAIHNKRKISHYYFLYDLLLVIISKGNLVLFLYRPLKNIFGILLGFGLY
jgi:cell fate (sporulation/competence/biofilm development) regulator YlbF (YheA/YmcA/DUF963 family)